MPSGIQRYGAYVPFFRLSRVGLGGRGSRAVAAYDENAVSMAVEASREAVRGFERGTVEVLLLASTSLPYLEKLNAATVRAALELPAGVLALDVAGSTRGGLGALLTAFDLAAAGRTVLVTSSDVMVGAPSGPRESEGGDAASAFVVGPGEGAARLIGRASVTEEVLDVWRSPEMPFARLWEERFGAEIFVPLLADVLKRSLADAGLQVSDLSKVVADGTNARAVATFLRTSGFCPEQLGDSLAASVGRSGAAHAGLMLAAALDAAAPGDRIAVVCGADGADAAIFEVTDAIDASRPLRSVERWISSQRDDLPYTTYLKWRGVLPFEPPRRPDPARPAAPPMHRSERWKYAFVGSRCDACGAANLPPQRVCVACGAVDRMTPEPFADTPCKIATYTIDRLAYSLQPPVVAAVADFENGGRFTCQLTDVDPEKVGIGDRLEMTFRRLYTAEGVHNYFWKARPQR
ncbi:MAG TPA: OB-fold domain-containing protein [Thermoanaerobaculia bacterium]|nr:OB-fold domain-containing protein [Thermoanaerobaculia bacterium]